MSALNLAASGREGAACSEVALSRRARPGPPRPRGREGVARAVGMPVSFD